MQITNRQDLIQLIDERYQSYLENNPGQNPDYVIMNPYTYHILEMLFSNILTYNQFNSGMQCYGAKIAIYEMYENTAYLEFMGTKEDIN